MTLLLWIKEFFFLKSLFLRALGLKGRKPLLRIKSALGLKGAPPPPLGVVGAPPLREVEAGGASDSIANFQ